MRVSPCIAGPARVIIPAPPTKGPPMRLGTGIGLLALLMGVALMFYLFTQNAHSVNQARKQIQPQAEQFSGHGPDGAPASASVKLDSKLKNGKTDALLVTDVTTGGALDRYFGLQKGDEIIQIG